MGGKALPTSGIWTQLEAESVDKQRVELWVPRREDVEADNCRGEEEGVALHNHQHGSTTNLKKTKVKKSIFGEILLGSKFVALGDIDYVKWTFLLQKASSWEPILHLGSLEIEATGAEGWVITMDMSKVQGGQSPVTLENSLTDSAVFKCHLFCWGLLFDVVAQDIWELL